MAKNITVSRFPYRHEDANKRIQVGIKLRVKEPIAQYDFPVKYSNGESLKLAKDQYKNLTSQHFNMVENYKHNIINAAQDLINAKIELTRETLEKRIDQINRKEFVNKVSGYLGYDIMTESELEELDAILKEAEFDEEDDMLEDIAESIPDAKISYEKKKREEEILNLNKIKKTIDRTRKQYSLLPNWDRNNIILQIGNLFTFDKENGKPLIHALNRGLLNNLYDYIITTGSSSDIASFDDNYCIGFVKHIVNNGVIKTSIARAPMELISGDYDDRFIYGNHEVLSYSTFIDKIKALNSVITNLSDKKISIKAERKFKTTDFIDGGAVHTEKGSNKDHHLKPREVQKLLNTPMEKSELELAKDTFLILVFCGGLRGIKGFDVEIEDDGILDVFHSKVNKRVSIPIFPEMETILSKYNGQFPKLPKEEELTFNLRAVAKELKWTRTIKTANTNVNKQKGDSYYFKHPLNEIIDQTFARKTFVNYARLVYEIPDGEIIQYTGHANVDMLKHYMGDLSVEEMRDRINKVKK